MGERPKTDNGVSRIEAVVLSSVYPPLPLSLLILERERSNYPIRRDKAIWPDESRRYRYLFIQPHLSKPVFLRSVLRSTEETPLVDGR